MRVGALGALIACASMSVVAATHVAAQAEEGGDNDARYHFRMGRAAYDSGHFEEAAHEFQQAYDLSHRPQLLFNLFVAYRDAGNLGAAIRVLREYLRLVPDAEDRESLVARLASMERLCSQQPGCSAEAGGAVTTNATTTTTTAAVTPTTTVTATTTTSGGGGGTWVPGWIIAAVGGAALVTSIITGVLALDAQAQLSRLCDANGACSAGFEGPQSSGSTLALTTDVLFFGGIAIAATGVILALVIPNGGGDAPQAGLFCDGTGCAGSLRARF